MSDDEVLDRQARFAGRAAIVTGGGSGLGFACAALLAREGAHVTICGRDAARTSVRSSRGWRVPSSPPR
jgi:NAD(P)-dependent dehydrogenase (short-subunit alcohol dehydrogenase family)